ncbi:HD domain-containing protein [Microbispora siamensis]|uniref:Histidine kinase/HSP90-like ATPase domain-containing protein n=1 Tax=Microbispora siamensis TaxID=564413 RepID=A0ABQ4GTM7_9ACTN|nr:ATP-binding protein [Microbispora siamensis]GIH64791.1 hypothetical protein Msi02_56080 [Microbispora siamensis]
MLDATISYAEKSAEQASKLPAFGGFSLLQAKREITELLSRIGSHNIFDEYTKHDIGHVDAMLSHLEWIVPDATKKIMTSADWLLTVLAAYFHDLGMLVTREEYASREQSAFPAFRDEILRADDDLGRDYVARLRDLNEDERERFLYQEFVRTYHASRVRAWIEGRPAPSMGITSEIAAEVQRILGALDDVFLDDLAVVCESHHLDDLHDLTRYPVSRPYGGHPQETANVQYAAVLLRTIDLLHITKDRTPSITYRIINPRDPISQTEWAKQSAVRAVRARYGVDAEGNLSADMPRDTIEVHARFSNADGFFGLTSYLTYAQEQLQKSHEWIAASSRSRGTFHEFPWRKIDTSNIETRGFLSQPFEFTLDQAKILDLLTGHTLYNDSSVVLRELLQNSIDAVRLAHGNQALTDGRIQVRWNENERSLEVWDNGTGMTQEIIEKNFLRAGSSRYQDPQFQKENPNFHPISRFGIGVLSAFMLADQVEVVTCHKEQQEARYLSLRSVHGKYLIRLLNKSEDAIAREIGSHGTMVRLKIRPSAIMPDVVGLARRWIVLPGCRISVHVEAGEEISVGYDSVADALRASLREAGITVEDPDTHSETKRPVRIVEYGKGNLSIAYAVVWDPYFKEWSFLTPPSSDSRLRRAGKGRSYYWCGMCVEGIRVNFEAPGYREDSPIWAIGNASGPGAPRTNVARSALEVTSEFRETLKGVYDAYCDHVVSEVRDLHENRSYSLTWATGEASILLHPLTNSRGGVELPQLLQESLKKVPIYVVEENGKRTQVSASELGEQEFLWTIESGFAEHIEYLLREVPGSTSFSDFRKVLGGEHLALPDGPILCTRLGRSITDELLRESWQVAEIHGDIARRRCDAKWISKEAGALWSSDEIWSSGIDLGRLSERTDRNLRSSFSAPIRVPLRPVESSGFTSGESAVVVGGSRYLLSSNPWREAVPALANQGGCSLDEKDPSLVALSVLLTLLADHRGRLEPLVDTIRQSEIADLLDLDSCMEIWRDSKWDVFDARRWRRWNASETSYFD